MDSTYKKQFKNNIILTTGHPDYFSKNIPGWGDKPNSPNNVIKLQHFLDGYIDSRVCFYYAHNKSFTSILYFLMQTVWTLKSTNAQGQREVEKIFDYVANCLIEQFKEVGLPDYWYSVLMSNYSADSYASIIQKLVQEGVFDKDRKSSSGYTLMHLLSASSTSSKKLLSLLVSKNCDYLAKVKLENTQWHNYKEQDKTCYELAVMLKQKKKIQHLQEILPSSVWQTAMDNLVVSFHSALTDSKRANIAGESITQGSDEVIKIITSNKQKYATLLNNSNLSLLKKSIKAGNQKAFDELYATDCYNNLCMASLCLELKKFSWAAKMIDKGLFKENEVLAYISGGKEKQTYGSFSSHPKVVQALIDKGVEMRAEVFFENGKIDHLVNNDHLFTDLQLKELYKQKSAIYEKLSSLTKNYNGLGVMSDNYRYTYIDYKRVRNFCELLNVMQKRKLLSDYQLDGIRSNMVISLTKTSLDSKITYALVLSFLSANDTTEYRRLICDKFSEHAWAAKMMTLDIEKEIEKFMPKAKNDDDNEGVEKKVVKKFKI